MKVYTCWLVFFAAAFLFFSCNTVPVIPSDASATQLIQMGQNSLDYSNYTAAEAYYNAAIQRYGMDNSVYLEANYELGHMYMKKKKYDLAYEKFSQVLAVYEGAEYGSVPLAFKVLSNRDVERIPEKYKKTE